MSDYWKRLKNHQGFPVAIFLSLTGLLMGLSRQDGNWWLGLSMSAFWIPVLLTARTEPLPREGRMNKGEVKQ